jgi:hypothetical protein
MIHWLIVGMKHFFKPDKVFLMDGIGAAISALLLLLIIVPFESFLVFRLSQLLILLHYLLSFLFIHCLVIGQNRSQQFTLKSFLLPI